MLLAILLAMQVPPPAETPARVIVSGRSSTLVSVTIVAVGQQVPPTYSKTVKNTAGMSWYVSQHYALKTDHDEAVARRYLTYAELAYPLHVAIVGRAPPEPDRLRMPFVMGTSYERMLDAIETDGGFRPTSIGGGGITYWGLDTAYDYPSGTLQYHQRDLVLHENLHLLQMCCGSAPTPHRLTEGITHTSSSHVFEEAAQRLTLSVFDKPTVNMPTTVELRDIRSHPCTFREVCERNSHVCLFTSFLWSDPARWLAWRAWRDAMMFGGRAGEDLAVMEEVLGPLDGAIEGQWKAWLAERHDTFHYRDWGWEQDGDTLIAYGWPQAGPFSRTDVLLPPGEPPAFDPMRMDYPLQAPPDLVGPVARGVAEPVIGALVGFDRCPGRGEAGIGLGVETARPTSELSYLPLLIRAETSLAIRGADLGLPDATVPLPDELRRAAAAGGHRFGLTARIGADFLEVTVRAREPAAQAPVEFAHRVALAPAQRQRLVDLPCTLLAKDGRHAITPCFDDARRPEPDLSVPAPANRWRFAGLAQLEGLYRARRLLGDAAPESLRALEQELLAAAGEPESHRRALRRCDEALAAVRRAVEGCAADDASRAKALEWIDAR